MLLPRRRGPACGREKSIRDIPPFSLKTNPAELFGTNFAKDLLKNLFENREPTALAAGLAGVFE
jgi:hypothetical protein